MLALEKQKGASVFTCTILIAHADATKVFSSNRQHCLLNTFFKFYYEHYP